MRGFISGVLALSIVVSGNGIVGFADKSGKQEKVEQGINIDCERITTQNQETVTSAVEQSKSGEVKIETPTDAKSETPETKEVKATSLSIKDKAIKRKEKKKRIFYKVQKVVDNAILLMVKQFICQKFLFGPIRKLCEPILVNVDNPFLSCLLYILSGTALVFPLRITLFRPFDSFNACEKFIASFIKLF